ncbi:MAG: VOC family protein [Dehalococcoidales bacterium]|nr:VOC family protein [Dehalococcoidales bacterium]
MKVKRLSHVAIMVKDIDKAGKLFTELFGFKFDAPSTTKETDTRTLMAAANNVEVVAPLTADGPASKSLEKRGEGLAMIAFDVDNLEEAIKDMQAHNIRMIGRADLPIGKTASFHPRDLFGVMVELIERKKK